MKLTLLILSYSAMIPQICGYLLQTYKTMTKGDVHTLSAFTFTQNYISSILWGLLAVFVDVIPSAIANAITLMGISILLGLIVKDRSKSSWKGYLLLTNLMIIGFGLMAITIVNAIIPFMFVSDTVKFITPIIAGSLSMSMFIPQLIKMIKTKDTKGFSYSLSMLYTFALVIWAIFWVLRGVDGFSLANWLIPFIFSVIPAIVQLIIIRVKYKTEKAAK